MLLPLENSCRQNYTERQIDFWVEFFTESHWTRPEILTAHRFLLAECKFLPSAADWIRVRPVSPGDCPPADEPLSTTAERLAATAPTSWARFIMQETARGLRAHDMPTAYDRIIAEGERRRVKPDEIQTFRQAKILTLEIRAGRILIQRQESMNDRKGVMA